MNKNRNIDPCKTCDVQGDLNGNEYYEEWKICCDNLLKIIK